MFIHLVIRFVIQCGYFITTGRPSPYRESATLGAITNEYNVGQRYSNEYAH